MLNGELIIRVTCTAAGLLTHSTLSADGVPARILGQMYGAAQREAKYAADTCRADMRRIYGRDGAGSFDTGRGVGLSGVDQQKETEIERTLIRE